MRTALRHFERQPVEYRRPVGLPAEADRFEPQREAGPYMMIGATSTAIGASAASSTRCAAAAA